jgi:hypothetical protein
VSSPINQPQGISVLARDLNRVLNPPETGLTPMEAALAEQLADWFGDELYSLASHANITARIEEDLPGDQCTRYDLRRGHPWNQSLVRPGHP